MPLAKFPLPTVVDPEDRISVCVPVPDDPGHRQAFLGALYLLSRARSWADNPAFPAKPVANVWAEIWGDVSDQLAARTGCEAMPFDVRQNEEEPCILEKLDDDGETWVPFADLQLCPPMIRIGTNGGTEYSVDGGETWTPMGSSPPIPRTPDDPDNRCLAAANAVNALVSLHYEVVRAYAPGIPLLALAMAVAAALLVLAGLPFLAIALVGEMGTLLIYAAELVNEAFTVEIQEELQCILYCNSTDDAGVVTFDYGTVQSEINSRVGFADMWRVIKIYVLIITEDGLNRAGAGTAITEAECDCPDCADELCPIWLFPLPITTPWSGYQTPGGWDQDEDGAFVYTNYEGEVQGALDTVVTVPTGCTLTGLSVTTVGTIGGGAYSHYEQWMGVDRADGLSTPGTFIYGSGISGGVHVNDRTIVGSGQEIHLNIGYVTLNLVPRITRIELFYEGDKPSFLGGIECE